MMVRNYWKGLAAGVGLAVSLAAPALAQTPTTWLLAVNYGPARAQSYWHVNMTGCSGVLIGLSPVAARVQMSDGTTQTFSISHGQFERLRNSLDSEISFNVRHDVLYRVAD